MIQYIVECIAFQLVFLIIYDFFLKRETFFQWNRVYLIGTYILSLVLPWIKIEALKTNAPQVFLEYPEFLWNTNDAAVIVADVPKSGFTISWEAGALFGGMFMAAVCFAIKLIQIQKLRTTGSIQSFPKFTRIVVENSELAFSFFRSIFLGDKVVARDHKAILQHEMVHIEQKHSWDLLFFEIMRIVAWFNPLVYVYQNRISELHEFIADAKVAKTSKKEQYEFLLSQVFQTQNISFINQFFKSSLIKKRIVMLQKSKSKKVFKLKYLALMPLVISMLMYSSCEMEPEESVPAETEMVVEDISNLTEIEDEQLFTTLKAYSDSGEYWEFVLKDENSSIKYTSSAEKSYIKFDGRDERIWATMVIEGPAGVSLLGSDSLGIAIAFSVIDEVPVFPGCENAENTRECFQKSMQKHISKNFRYPEEAQEKGIQGRVSIMFTISTDGSIQNVRMRGPDKLLEEEAARIISLLPEMTPGKQDGKVVNVPFSIPISFRLQSFDSDAANESSKNEIEKENIDGVPFAVVEEVPVFPGCENAENTRECFQKMMQKHIGDNFKYPEEAQEKGIQGRVSIMFTISTDGSIQNVKMRGPDKLLEEEAARIISLLPKMTPGKQNGKVVNVPLSIPISFALGENKIVKTSNGPTLNFNTGVDPLYYVDGVKKTKEEIELISQTDIASINVLKGESAKAVYGEEAKNGAIIITLKEKD
ncbi:TonB family protein [Aurantibacter sp.]|uniref:TonB family protein n=1 Tax=Aurantibacter sp. TaxID=2807103 RepID=UPI003263FAE3